MRGFALGLAVIYVVLSALAALWMLFSAWFPYENLSDEELGKDDWLAIAAPLVLGSAVAAFVFVMRDRLGWALAAVVAHGLVGGAALLFALDELSDSSDSELVVFGVSVGLSGIAAVAVAFGAQRRIGGGAL